MTQFTVEGASVFLPDDVVDTNVSVSDGVIVEIGGPVQGASVDGRGLILGPALVDVHGDAFERQLMPRPGTFFPMDTAVLETDRQLAANGIATAYHALTLSWEPGLRSVDRGRDFVKALARLQSRLTVENRIQLRWETFCFEAIPLMEEALKSPLTPSLAFNDHTSMSMLAPDIALQDRPFDLAPDFPTTNTDAARFLNAMEGRAKRSGVTPAEFTELLLRIWDQRPDVPAAIDRVAKAGRAAGAPMLSHDDTQAETRHYYRSQGATASEFPMQVHVAEAARAAGDTIIFGAPNATRGGSHIGSPGAGDMVEAGLCDALASDYYYPAMLAGVAKLEAERRAPRADLWKLVSSGAAKSMGLHDRGEIVTGKRADLVLVDWPKDQVPVVRHTIVGGRTAYKADPMAA